MCVVWFGVCLDGKCGGASGRTSWLVLLCLNTDVVCQIGFAAR
jgi:hypothetical protein